MQAQQGLVQAPAGAEEVGADPFGKGMGAIHHPTEAALAARFDQGSGDGPRAGQGPHLQLQGRMGGVGPARRLAHHAHPQAPAPRQQRPGQLGPLANPTHQPDRVCWPRAPGVRVSALVRAGRLPLVDFRAVHQDGAPWRTVDP